MKTRGQGRFCVKESAASALWTATKADVEERQRVAELMGPATFSQFLRETFNVQSVPS